MSKPDRTRANKGLAYTIKSENERTVYFELCSDGLHVYNCEQYFAFIGDNEPDNELDKFIEFLTRRTDER